MKKEIMFLIGSTILPLIFTISWLSQNNMLPAADAAGYIAGGVSIYQKFIDGGILKGIHAIFSLRGWRPIFFPVITVPFLGLSKGNLLVTYNCSVVSIIFLCCVYVYLFLRLKLDRISAMLGTTLICLLPSVLNPTLEFFAESLLMPFVIGALYHLIKKQMDMFIVCVTMAALLRPVEAYTELILPLMYYLFYCYRNDRSAFNKFMISSSIILLLITIWYLPFHRELYEWVYRASFGDIANSDPRHPIQLWTNVKYQIVNQGVIPVLGIMAIAAWNRFKNLCSVEVLYLLLLIPLPLIEVLFTIQNSPRKLAIAFTAFLMAALIMGMKRGYAWVLATPLIIGQLLYAHVNKPVYFRINPYDQVENYLVAAHEKYHFKSLSILFRTTGYDPIDPFALTMINAARNTRFSAGYSFFSKFDDETIKEMNGFDAIFVADNSDRMMMSKNTSNFYHQQFINEGTISHKTLDYFLYLYASNKLSGWKVNGCIDVVSLRGENYRGCLLLKEKQ
jgi:hypothetical protein